jgi:hypothetical protein
MTEIFWKAHESRITGIVGVNNKVWTCSAEGLRIWDAKVL